MNEAEAGRLWSRLEQAGIVSGTVPTLDVEASTPWPVRWLSGIGAWIAVLLLLAFLATALGPVFAEAGGAVFIAVIMMIASTPWVRAGRSEFQRQTATVVNVAGVLLLGVGVAVSLDLSIDAAAVAMALAAVVMFALSGQWLHRLLVAGVVLGCAFWLLVGERGGAERLALAQLLTVWSAMAAWLILLYADPHAWPRRALDPAAWALTVATLLLAWVAPWLAGWVGEGALFWTPSFRFAAAAALPAVTFALVWPRRLALGLGPALGLIVATALLAWVWRWAPGITVSISLLLLAVPLGATVLFTTSIGSLALSLILYYYHLGDTLLAKSLALAIAGVVVGVLYLLLWARSRQVAR